MGQRGAEYVPAEGAEVWTLVSPRFRWISAEQRAGEAGEQLAELGEQLAEFGEPVGGAGQLGEQQDATSQEVHDVLRLVASSDEETAA